MSRAANSVVVPSALVDRRIEQNRRFLHCGDLPGPDRGLCFDRLTEREPPCARKLRVVGRADPCEEMLLVRGWSRRPVGRLEDVPQTSGQGARRPTGVVQGFSPSREANAMKSMPRHATHGGPPVAAERGGSGAAARRRVPAIRARATGLRSGTSQPAIDRDACGVIAAPSVAGPMAGVPCPRARNAWRF